MKVHFKFYDKNEFEQFISNLPNKDRRKLLGIFKIIETNGILPAIMMKWVKKMKGYNNLYEIRSRFAKNYQRCMYFHLVNNNYVVTNCYSKKSNKTPQSVIDKALKREKIYLSEKQGDNPYGRN